MTKIIAVANQKGGVGKTTTSVNLSAALAQHGKRVMLVDLDPQGNSTSGLGINKKRACSVYDILINEADPKSAVCESCVEGLSVLPSAMSLAGAEVELVNMDRREQRLKEALSSFSEGFDYVLIDCPPSLGLLTLNAFCYADKLLIPIQCEYYALEGLSLLMNTLRLVRNGLNPRLELCGVVLTMFDGRTNLSAQVVSEVKKFYKEKLFNTIIPRAVRLGEAPSYGQPVCIYAPRNIGTVAYDNLAQELIKREG